MRRSIVPLSLLLAATAIWVLGIASPAGAASRAPRIACRTADAHIVPCCPLPPGPVSGKSDVQPICCQATCCTNSTTPCCQTTACCQAAGTPCCTPTPCTAGSLTIASAPNPSIAGRKVVISGAFVGSAASGARIVLWRKPAGQPSFRQVAQTTTDSAGRYTFTLRRGTVMADQAWYVTSNGVRSATLQQHVDALVGLSASSRSTAAGQAVVLRGRVTPSHAGQTVLIEQSRGGTWRIIARARLGRGSSYAISHRFSQQGTVRLRTVLRRDARNDQSISPTVALSVKP